MDPSSLSPMQQTAGQIALAVFLAVVGFAFLLPQPKTRRVMPGITALIVSAVVFAAWLYSTYGRPMADSIGSALFWLFAGGALVFGTVLVVQKNPARGAIAFAFVILSTCGLFLLMGATFLMAATIIIYAGAIIVTFLFVLMLSHVEGPANENDRSREPLFGAFAGFAFTGLVLFTLYITALGRNAVILDESPNPPPVAQRLPAVALTNRERFAIAEVIAKLDAAETQLAGDKTPPDKREAVTDYFEDIKNRLVPVVGSDVPDIKFGSIHLRLEKIPAKAGEKIAIIREDQQTRAALEQATKVRNQNDRANDAVFNHVYQGKPTRETVRNEVKKLREEVLLLAGMGELPARNVGNLGYLLYSEHLLAVELAGTLLLVATIGAIAIAHRKEATA